MLEKDRGRSSPVIFVARSYRLDEAALLSILSPQAN
jgi:hypothetical protein